MIRPLKLLIASIAAPTTGPVVAAPAFAALFGAALFGAALIVAELFVAALVVVALWVGDATPVAAQPGASISMNASLALQSGNYEQALKAAEQLVAQDPLEPRAALIAADVFLRCNQPARAVPLYDAYLIAFPEAMPRLWQRGIALYFDGQYQLAAEQFESHREVNPHDVENAAWHLLCVAKAKSFQEAKAAVLPAPNDPRIPMAEVQQMLPSGDPSFVTERLKQIAPDSPQYASAMFYGNFYLGLYADAQGDRQTALEYLRKAAKDAPRHYMGDIARVYAERLAAPESDKPSEQEAVDQPNESENG